MSERDASDQAKAEAPAIVTTAIVTTTGPDGREKRVLLPDAAPPEEVSRLAGEYVGLCIVGGLAAGMLLGAALPRGAGRKLARGAGRLAGAAGEAGLAAAGQALARASAKRSQLGATAVHLAEALRTQGRDTRDRLERKSTDFLRSIVDFLIG